MKIFCVICALANLAMWFVAHETYSLIIGNVWGAAYVILRNRTTASAFNEGAEG